jgi:type II secretion system protein H
MTTLRTILNPGNHCGRLKASGFTLVELLLVLALLAIVMAVGMPSLSNFFRGRALDSEARRLLSLTRHGQSRAVSEGIPMLLWVDEKEKRYGLEQEPGWEEKDVRAVEFKLDPDLEIEVVQTNLAALVSLLPERRFSTTEMTEAQRMNLPEIRFLPDGTIEETSPVGLRLTGRDGAALLLSQSTNRLRYDLRVESK